MQLAANKKHLTSELADLTANLFRGLGDLTRTKIVGHLIDGNENVTELVRPLNLSQGRVSNHLSYLR